MTGSSNSLSLTVRVVLQSPSEHIQSTQLNVCLRQDSNFPSFFFPKKFKNKRNCQKQMAGSTPLAPSSVPPVSGLNKDRVLGKTHQSQQLSTPSNRFLSKKMPSTVGIHKMSDQPINPTVTRKSSVFTIENLLAPSIKSPTLSPIVNSRTLMMTNHTSSPEGDNIISPSALTASDMVQQQLQYHQQNLFSVVGHNHQHHHQHQHLMPLGLSDPSTYGYTYLGRKFQLHSHHLVEGRFDERFLGFFASTILRALILILDTRLQHIAWILSWVHVAYYICVKKISKAFLHVVTKYLRCFLYFTKDGNRLEIASSFENRIGRKPWKEKNFKNIIEFSLSNNSNWIISF